MNLNQRGTKQDPVVIERSGSCFFTVTGRVSWILTPPFYVFYVRLLPPSRPSPQSVGKNILSWTPPTPYAGQSSGLGVSWGRDPFRVSGTRPEGRVPEPCFTTAEE